MSELIDGKAIAAKLKEALKEKVAKLIDDEDKDPHLAAVLVGEDPASQTYVAAKEKACKSVGIVSTVYRLPQQISEEELLQTIDFLNRDPELDGFIVQLPLPRHINETRVTNAINPEKDVDGFHPVNIGKMVLGQDAFLPATPYGIVKMLEASAIETEGKHVVVVGRSNIVGTPVSIMLSRKAKHANATVSLCHSMTKNLGEITRQADILIAAIGKPNFIKADMVKDGAIVIDVGIHRIEDTNTEKGYRLVGDVDFPEVQKKASRISPVPGGVGPMTIYGLLENTYKAASKKGS